jgi:DNA-binding transcriptional LysR family regulator
MPRIRKRSADLPDLHSLHVFNSVQQTGSFKEAALRLGVTVSAISQSVQLLEAGLSQELFDRSQRPVALTPFGHKYLPMAVKLIEAARAYELACEGLLHNRQREIRIGCVDSFAATVGPLLVKSMSHRSGNVVMLSGITPQILTHLIRQDIDMAICTQVPQNLPDQTNIHIEPICAESWVVVSPNELEWPRQLSFKQLRQLTSTLPIVRYTQRSNIGTLIDQLLAHVRVDPPRRFEFDASDSLLSLVASGVGWAVTSPLCLLQSEHHAKRVRISRLPASTHEGRTFYLISRNEASGGLTKELGTLVREILGIQLQRQLQAVNPTLGKDLLRVLK